MRLHPGLPTVQEALDNPREVFSDHVPILVKIAPLDFYILSWNVRETLKNTAFTMDAQLVETSAQKIERYKRVARSLKVMIEKNPLAQCIVLQEMGAEIFLQGKEEIQEEIVQLMSFVRKKIGNDWQFVSLNGSVFNVSGNLTLYRTSHLELDVASMESFYEKSFSHKRNFSRFFMKKDREAVEVFNVSFDFSEFPVSREAEIEKILKEDRFSRAVRIVVGGLNCFFAPLGGEIQNLTTCVSSPKFGNGREQDGYAVDGAFYAYYHYDHLVFCQAEIVSCDVETGEPIVIDRLQPKFFSTLSMEQQQHMKKMRLPMRVKMLSENDWLPQGKKRSEYQDFLKQKIKSLLFSDVELVQLRPARNLWNEPGLAIAIPAEIYHAITLYQDADLQLRHFLEGPLPPKYFLCIAKSAWGKLDLLFGDFFDLMKLANQVRQLKLGSFSAALEQLCGILWEELCVYPSKTHQIIIQHFVQLVADIQNTAHIGGDAVYFQRSIEQLEKKLLGVPQIGKSLRVGISAVVGAGLGVSICLPLNCLLLFFLSRYDTLVNAALSGFVSGLLSGGLSVGGVSYWHVSREEKQRAEYQLKEKLRLENTKSYQAVRQVMIVATEPDRTPRHTEGSIEIALQEVDESKQGSVRLTV